jgi:hypothetical protein
MKAFYNRHRRGIEALGLLASAGLIYLVMSFFGVGCLLRDLLGICCPGCGLTRACVSALKGDFAKAFYYHPLWVWVIPLAGSLTVFWFKRMRRATVVLLSAVCVLMLAVYFYRLFFLGGEIVYADLSRGRLWEYIEPLLNSK